MFSQAELDSKWDFLDRPGDLVRVQGYQTVCKDRKHSRGGGLIVYIRNEIHYERREDPEVLADETTEIIYG